nr:hypothetical protein [Ardenticatena sp.]
MRPEAARARLGSRNLVPQWLVLVGFVLGLIVGLVYAYQINPVEWKDALPIDLRQDYKEQWVLMAARAYAIEQNSELALERMRSFSKEEATDLLNRVYQDAATESDREQLRQFGALFGIDVGAATQLPTGEGAGEQTPPPAEQPEEGGSLFGTLIRLCLVGVVALLVAVGALQFWTNRRRKAGELFEPGARREPTLDLSVEPEAEGAFGGYEEPLPETGPMPAVGEKSIGRFTTRYEYGSDNFDMSFSIQLPDNTYLGECGVGVGDILLDQPHQHVGAFEVWLFDKDDIQTVTKLLVSEALADNPDAIAALSERGEVIVAREGETFELETASLRVRARVRSLKYGDNPALEPNSYFERLELELEPFQKADGGGGIEY